MLSLVGVAGILLSGEVTMVSKKIEVENPSQSNCGCGESGVLFVRSFEYCKIMGRTKWVGGNGYLCGCASIMGKNRRDVKIQEGKNLESESCGNSEVIASWN